MKKGQCLWSKNVCNYLTSHIRKHFYLCTPPSSHTTHNKQQQQQTTTTPQPQPQTHSPKKVSLDPLQWYAQKLAYKLYSSLVVTYFIDIVDFTSSWSPAATCTLATTGPG